MKKRLLIISFLSLILLGSTLIIGDDMVKDVQAIPIFQSGPY